jgi:hypothetical protein
MSDIKYGFSNDGLLVLTDGEVYIGFHSTEVLDVALPLDQYIKYNPEETERLGLDSVEWADYTGDYE